LIFFLFTLTAFFYAMAGFGGGSTYLALLSLWNFPYQSIPVIALCCNLVVVSGGFFHYQKKKLIPWRKTLPLVLFSVPTAYLGGLTPVSQKTFFILLAFSLTIAGLRLLWIGKETKEITTFNNNSPHAISFMTGPAAPHPQFRHRSHPFAAGANWGPPGRVTRHEVLKSRNISNKIFSYLLYLLYPLLGTSLGYLSGLVGIGGGIFLAPILYLTRWEQTSKIAATCNFFILVNSLSGLAGQIMKNGFNSQTLHWVPLLLAVFVGGQLGTRMSTGLLRASDLQRITAILILTVSLRMLWKWV